jgi:BASS family bile acid:Na+ symporter
MPANEITLNFSPESLVMLNVCLAFIMFSVALNLRWENLRYIVRSPYSVIAGIASQYLFLPALTGLLIVLIEPSRDLAAGMILLAACPGGNVSNFFSLVGKGNIELSVALTTVSSLASAFTTPLLFVLWSPLIPGDGNNAAIVLPFLPTLVTIVWVIVLPAIAGMVIAHRYAGFAHRINGPLQKLSMLVLVGFIVMALAGNYQNFINHIAEIFWIVAVFHFLAALGGFFIPKLMRRPLADRITISLETSIQNTALGLLITFNFFDGNGTMAFILAWWGVWHLLGGFVMSRFFRRLSPAS